MKLLIILIALFSYCHVYCQVNGSSTIDIRNSIKKNIVYKEIDDLTCNDAPSGFYFVWFKVVDGGKVEIARFSHDSIPLLRLVFVRAIVKTGKDIANQARWRELKGRMLCQPIFFDNMACEESKEPGYKPGGVVVDSIIQSPLLLSREMNRKLKEQLLSIQTSLEKFENPLRDNPEALLLKPVSVSPWDGIGSHTKIDCDSRTTVGTINPQLLERTKVQFDKRRQTPRITDTLKWLKENVEAKSSWYYHKPLKVLFDSLKAWNIMAVDYEAPVNIGRQILDTNKTDFIRLYMHPGFIAVMPLHMDSYSLEKRRDTLNTHVPYLMITFTEPVHFLSNWYSYDRDGLGSIRWNEKLERFWGEAVVKSVWVAEF